MCILRCDSSLIFVWQTKNFWQNCVFLHNSPVNHPLSAYLQHHPWKSLHFLILQPLQLLGQSIVCMAKHCFVGRSFKWARLLCLGNTTSAPPLPPPPLPSWIFLTSFLILYLDYLLSTSHPYFLFLSSLSCSSCRYYHLFSTTDPNSMMKWSKKGFHMEQSLLPKTYKITLK